MDNIANVQAGQKQLLGHLEAMRDIMFHEAMSSQQSPPSPFKKDESRFDTLDTPEFRGQITIEKALRAELEQYQNKQQQNIDSLTQKLKASNIRNGTEAKGRTPTQNG
uniref:Uncharacterized protein n=1 Tax=Globodera rostochiensis TaxID=31243 RepID=A0A914H8D7_GLORO